MPKETRLGAAANEADRHESNLDKLWNAFVFEKAGERAESIAEREALALRVLQQLRNEVKEALRDRRGEAALRALRDANAAWQLLASSLGEFLLGEDEDETGGSQFSSVEDLGRHYRNRVEGYLGASFAGARARIQLIAKILGGQLPAKIEDFYSDLVPGEQSVDPVAVLLPRDLLVRLSDALVALNYGEQHSMVLPIQGEKRDRAWTRQLMQLEALDYVAFLEGQGTTKTDARFLVSEAIGKSPDTLRQWERDCRRSFPAFLSIDKDLEIAREAGLLTQKGLPATNGLVARFVEHVTEQSLEEFGRIYRSASGAATFRTARLPSKKQLNPQMGISNVSGD